MGTISKRYPQTAFFGHFDHSGVINGRSMGRMASIFIPNTNEPNDHVRKQKSRRKMSTISKRYPQTAFFGHFDHSGVTNGRPMCRMASIFIPNINEPNVHVRKQKSWRKMGTISKRYTQTAFFGHFDHSGVTNGRSMGRMESIFILNTNESWPF